MNETIKTLMERRSVRAYKPGYISDEELNTILECGKFSPTGMGLQDVKYVAVKNKELLAKLEKLNAKYTNNPDGKPFYGAPEAVIVFCDGEDYNWLQNGSLAMGTLMNAAYALGIGSCWINRGIQMFDDPEGRAMSDEWGIPSNYKGIAVCILGYPDETPVAKPRKEGMITIIE